MKTVKLEHVKQVVTNYSHLIPDQTVDDIIEELNILPDASQWIDAAIAPKSDGEYNVCLLDLDHNLFVTTSEYSVKYKKWRKYNPQIIWYQPLPSAPIK